MTQKTILTQSDTDIILDALKKFSNPDPDSQCKTCDNHDACHIIDYKNCDKVIGLQEMRKELEGLGLLDAYEIFAKVDLVLAEINEHQQAIEELENKRTNLISQAVKFRFVPPETQVNGSHSEEDARCDNI